MLWRGTHLQEKGGQSFSPYSQVASMIQGVGVPQRCYFQNISRALANLKGSRPLGLAWPPRQALPRTTCLFALLLANTCCAIGHNPGLTVKVELEGAYTGHT